MATRAEKVASNKQAKKKKVLFLLVPALVVVVAIQGPRLKDQLQGAKEKTQSVQGNVVEGIKEVAPTDATTAAGTITTGSTVTSASDPLSSATAALAAGELPDTDALIPANEDELISFTRFAATDPFVQIVDDTSVDGSVSADGTSDVGAIPEPFPVPVPIPGVGTTTGGGTATTGPTQASISVNGVVGAVSVGDTFPAGDPAFTLVSIDGNTVKIGLSTGSFSSGAETLDLAVGDSVTLISQPDGARFTVNIIEIA